VEGESLGAGDEEGALLDIVWGDVLALPNGASGRGCDDEGAWGAEVEGFSGELIRGKSTRGMSNLRASARAGEVHGKQYSGSNLATLVSQSNSSLSKFHDLSCGLQFRTVKICVFPSGYASTQGMYASPNYQDQYLAVLLDIPSTKAFPKICSMSPLIWEQSMEFAPVNLLCPFGDILSRACR